MDTATSELDFPEFTSSVGVTAHVCVVWLVLLADKAVHHSSEKNQLKQASHTQRVVHRPLAGRYVDLKIVE